MKPNTQVINSTGDLAGEKVQMGFDANSLSHLMGLLTNLYSNPELAVVREYSTNALDSHVVSGQTRPIEITTPNRLSPYFKVKDYGLGMSADDIRYLYSQYGASTKRSSNEATGMLGVGSKSGLTYANQFNLIGIKNGIKTNVSVSRSTDGGGSMEIINEIPTDEHNGVEIIIPAKRYHEFDKTCRNFFKYWDKNTVLINGKPPADNGFIHVGKNLYIDPSLTNWDNDVVVMGGISYQLKHRLTTHLVKPAVLYVPIGSVDFVPSREELHHTARTTAFIDQAKSEVSQIVTDYLDSTIGQAKNEQEALACVGPVSKVINRNLIKWNNKAVPDRFEKEGKHVWDEDDQTERAKSFTTSDKVVVGFNLKQVTRSHKRKIKKYREDKGIIGPVFLIDELPDDAWLKDFPVIQWDDINNIKIDSLPREKHIDKPLDVYNFEIRQWEKGVPAGKKLVYSFRSYNWKSNWKPIEPYLKDVVLVEIQPRQVQSFKKKYACEEYKDHVKKCLEDALKNWPHPVPTRFEMMYADERWARGQSIHDYDDPDLKTTIARYKDLQNQNYDKNVSDYAKLYDDAVRWGASVNSPYDVKIYDSVIENKYPFVQGTYMTTQTQIEVMNAYYYYYYAPNAPKKKKGF